MPRRATTSNQVLMHSHRSCLFRVAASDPAKEYHYQNDFHFSGSFRIIVKEWHGLFFCPTIDTGLFFVPTIDTSTVLFFLMFLFKFSGMPIGYRCTCIFSDCCARSGNREFGITCRFLSRPGAHHEPLHGPRWCGLPWRQNLHGSFSAVSKPNFASKN